MAYVEVTAFKVATAGRGPHRNLKGGEAVARRPLRDPRTRHRGGEEPELHLRPRSSSARAPPDLGDGEGAAGTAARTEQRAGDVRGGDRGAGLRLARERLALTHRPVGHVDRRRSDQLDDAVVDDPLGQLEAGTPETDA